MSQPLCTVGSDLVLYCSLFPSVLGQVERAGFPEVFVLSLLTGVNTDTPEVLQLKI